MEKAETMMLIASTVGAILGIFFTLASNPINNFYIFLIIFPVTGICAALLVLIGIYRVYKWVIH